MDLTFVILLKYGSGLWEDQMAMEIVRKENYKNVAYSRERAKCVGKKSEILTGAGVQNSTVVHRISQLPFLHLKA